MRLLIYSDLHLESHSFTPPPAAVNRVISNPRGYRTLWLDETENPRFDPAFTVEFPWPKRPPPTV